MMWKARSRHVLAASTATAPWPWTSSTEGSGNGVLLTLVGCAGLAAWLLSLALQWMG